MVTRSKPMPKLCVVSIDHSDYLLPTDKALKLMELLSGALRCRRDYAGDGYKFHAQGEPDIELRNVAAHQVVLPTPQAPTQPARAGTPRLTHMPAKPAHFDEGQS